MIKLNHLSDPIRLMFSDKNISLDVLFFSLLLCLIPIALTTGPALPDIFLSLIGLYFLILSISQKLWIYYKNPITIGFLIFSFYGILRSLFSDMPIESLLNEGSVFYFRYIFFAMGVWYLLDKNYYLAKCLLLITVACLLFVCLDGFYQYLNEKNLFGNIKHTGNRLTGLMGDEPVIGRYIAYLSLFSFTLIYQNFQKSKIMMFLSITYLVICEVLVFLSGERVPLFLISFFCILVLIYMPDYRIYRLIGIFVSFILIYGILEIKPNAKIRMIDQTIEQMKETKIPFLPYNKGYEEHYISAITLFKNKPLFGVGTNTYRFQCDNNNYKLKSNCNSHPHHYYLQVLAELGIVGFLFLFTFFASLLYIGIRQLIYIITKNKSKQLPFETLLYPMILFIYWWPLIPHMSFYNNWNNVMVMLPLGFFMRYYFNKK